MAKVNPIQLQKALKGTKYPAKKQALLDRAKANGADAGIMSALQELPDSDYSRPSDVSRAVRGDAEGGSGAGTGASGSSGGTARRSKTTVGGAKPEGSAGRASGGTKAGGTSGRASGGSKRQSGRDTTPSQAEGDRGTVERNLRKKGLE